MAQEPEGNEHSSAGQEIPARIRTRRLKMGLRAYELAKRVGVSPSWISLIEKGRKVPSEAVAARIAEALGEDVDRYRIWAGKARLGDKALSWVNSLERWQGLWSRAPFLQKPRAPNPPAWLSAKPRPGETASIEPPTGTPSRREILLDELNELDERALLEDDGAEEEVAALLARERSQQRGSAEGSGVFPGAPAPAEEAPLRWIPLLSSPDIIPARGEMPAHAILGTFPADMRLLPESSGHLIALEVTRESGAFVAGRLLPGDLVVIDLEDREAADPVPTDQIYLVRTRAGSIFSRCAIKSSLLILQPDTPEMVAEVIEIPSGSTTLPLIVGRVIWSAHRYVHPPR